MGTAIFTRKKERYIQTTQIIKRETETKTSGWMRFLPVPNEGKKLHKTL